LRVGLKITFVAKDVELVEVAAPHDHAFALLLEPIDAVTAIPSTEPVF
jgi:hypothetical protein